MTEEMTQKMQNQLLGYRSKHLPDVSKSELCAANLSPDFNAIASTLVRVLSMRQTFRMILYHCSPRIPSSSSLNASMNWERSPSAPRLLSAIKERTRF